MGSGLEYGKNTHFHKETFKCKPKSFYAKAKYLATKHLLELYKQKNFLSQFLGSIRLMDLFKILID